MPSKKHINSNETSIFKPISQIRHREPEEFLESKDENSYVWKNVYQIPGPYESRLSKGAQEYIEQIVAHRCNIMAAAYAKLGLSYDNYMDDYAASREYEAYKRINLPCNIDYETFLSEYYIPQIKMTAIPIVALPGDISELGLK